MDLSNEAIWLALAVAAFGVLAASAILSVRCANSKRESDVDTIRRVMRTKKVMSVAQSKPRAQVDPRRKLAVAGGGALAFLVALLLTVERPVDYPMARDYELIGPVSHYRDGDTIEVNGMAVRFQRLDCPEMDTGEGARAKWAIIQLTRGKELNCVLTGDRSYDRWIGSCRLPDGRSVSRAMVQGGYCSWYRLPNFRPVSKDRLMGTDQG